jgi:hypothetical protein
MKEEMKEEIKTFIHCGKCLDEVYEMDGTSAKNYARIAVGYTETGVQLWCNRHEQLIVNIPVPPSLRMNYGKCKCDSCKQMIEESLSRVLG